MQINRTIQISEKIQTKQSCFYDNGLKRKDIYIYLFKATLNLEIREIFFKRKRFEK